MSLSELILLQVKSFLFGDRPLLGLLRLLFFVVIPLLLFAAADILRTILGIFPAYFRQLILLYFLGLISAFVSAVIYTKDIYEQDTDQIPFRHFAACFFGILTPKIKISNRIQDSPWKEMVEKVGGPAVLKIESGYAVLTETLTAPAHIYGQGNNFISRQERVYEIIDLHEQEGAISEVKATTRDGIEVIVEKLKFNYRIWDSQWDTSQKNDDRTRKPFPFSNEAIYGYAYNRSVQLDENKKSKPFAWSAAVGRHVKGIIKDYINEHRLDEVIASREHEKKNPREEIRNQAYESKFKNSLRSIGTTLRWWDPGEFKSPENIEGQFLANWSVDLASNVKLNRAYGDAQKQAYEELGRAEAEAELLMSIIHALDGIKFASDKTHTLQNLILMRTAQVINAFNTPARDDPSPAARTHTQDAGSKETK